MKSTISDIRQLFNVKAIADAGLVPSAIPPYTLGIVDESTNKTVKPADFKTMPESFRLIYKNGKQVLYSFDTIRKNRILNVVKKDYVAPKNEIWETTINHCTCMDIVRLRIEMDSDLQNTGQYHHHHDTYVELTPAEMECYSPCNQPIVYANHVITMSIFEKAKAKNNPLYEIVVKDDSGKEYTDVTELREYVKTNKAQSTNPEGTAKPLKLVVKAKTIETSGFEPLTQDYQYVRTVNLRPHLSVNNMPVEFVKTQEGVAEVGAGSDLRYEEFENYNFYTDNNYRQYLKGDLLNNDYGYMFENGKNYSTLTFEYDSLKQNRAGEGDTKRFLVVFGAEAKQTITTLEKMFKPTEPNYRATV